MKHWDGTNLTGEWVVSLKYDGVQVVKHPDGSITSRSGKPLHNVPQSLPTGKYECFNKNWETSVSLVRTHNGSEIPLHYFFCLDPIDKRAISYQGNDPTAKLINSLFQEALRYGMEGLVLHGPGGQLLKVKPKETHDVKVIGYQDGKGKHTGRLGALLTTMGKVGTGFTDEQRDTKLYPVGSIIEVECMGLTPNGKFRHPRFVRARFDK